MCARAAIHKKRREPSGDALTIREFCERNGIRLGRWRELRRAGEAPTTMKMHGRTVIAVAEAERRGQDMRRRMEAALAYPVMGGDVRS